MTTVQELAGASALTTCPSCTSCAHWDHQQPLRRLYTDPVIDHGRLLNTGRQRRFSEDKKLRSAIESWGLFMVSNHGDDAEVIDSMRVASEEFSDSRWKRSKDTVT
ncbi:hypothetical protein ZWY2020_024600 [Hordeum vulgare]|nr:hypothetical protein ZWY2020_024600 [Hordeum vulgare]